MAQLILWQNVLSCSFWMAPELISEALKSQSQQQLMTTSASVAFFLLLILAHVSTHIDVCIHMQLTFSRTWLAFCSSDAGEYFYAW